MPPSPPVFTRDFDSKTLVSTCPEVSWSLWHSDGQIDEWLTRGRTLQAPQPDRECMNGRMDQHNILSLFNGTRNGFQESVAFANTVGFKQKRANWTKLLIYCPSTVFLVVSGLTQ